MRILLNCTTVQKGGALQASLSIINNIFSGGFYDKIEWFFCISQEISQQVKLVPGKVFVLRSSPARSYKMRRKLKSIVTSCEVDAVLTLFGPAYTKFEVPHVCGVADGWVTHGGRRVFRSLNSTIKKIKVLLQCFYKAYWYRQADYWVVEAAVAKSGLEKRLLIPPSRISIIPNTVSHCFKNYWLETIKRQKPSKFKMLVLGADYSHKNYQIIPKVISSLVNAEFDKFCITLTLPENSYSLLMLRGKLEKMGLSHYINNVGPVLLEDVPDLYIAHDLLFFPTLLETFSVTPLEALVMNCPMAISDLPENREIVGDCALYFNPESVEDAVKVLLEILNNYEEYIGSNAMEKFELQRSKHSAHSRYKSYQQLLTKFLE